MDPNSLVLSSLAICERCWISRHVEWEPHSMAEDGTMRLVMKDFIVPEKLNIGEVEFCIICGSITIAGLYEFVYLENADPTPPEASDHEG